VVSDGGYGESTEFRDGLEARRLAYVVGNISYLGSVDEAAQSGYSTTSFGQRRSGHAAYHYGKQRPVSAQEAGGESQRVEVDSLAAKARRVG